MHIWDELKLFTMASKKPGINRNNVAVHCFDDTRKAINYDNEHQFANTLDMC